LAIFSGPHAYVSAAWYDEPDTVPTWNYLAVHAEGELTWIDDAMAGRALFARLAQAFDADGGAAWSARLSEAAFTRMQAGIAWFRLECVTVVGKAKLSQNHPPERRARAIAALRALGGEDGLAIAEAMAR
jgi:transcriptional regulator